MSIQILDVVKKVQAQASQDDQEVFVDPVTIMLVCSILSTLFSAARLYCQWRQGQKAAEGVKEVCMNPGFFKRRAVMNQIAASDTEGRLAYGQRKRLMNAFFEAGKNASVEEIQEVLDSSEQGWYGEWEV
jgi:hypothetical protein